MAVSTPKTEDPGNPGRAWPDKSAGGGKPRPYDIARIAEAEISQGTRLLLTLPDAEQISEGEQDVERWVTVGPKLNMGTHVEITNDRRTWWVLARVETIAGGRGVGLKGLSLRFIVPPQISDRDGGEEKATGAWHFRYSGPFKKFEIVAPNGQVRLDGINKESEARLRCAEMERNSGVFRR